MGSTDLEQAIRSAAEAGDLTDLSLTRYRGQWQASRSHSSFHEPEFASDPDDPIKALLEVLKRSARRRTT